jgi:hypothetical protein
MAFDGLLLPVAIGRDALAFAPRSPSSSGAARARRLLGVIRGASGRALLITILPLTTIPLGAQSASIQNRGSRGLRRSYDWPAGVIALASLGVTRGHLAGDWRIAGGTPNAHSAGRVSEGALQQGPERQWQARPTVDQEQLHGGAIALTELPPAAGLTLRATSGRDAASIWRSGFIGTALLIMLQTVLIVILLVQRVRRQTIERFLRTNEVALRSSLARVRQLAGLMINVQEADRSRIARDLHDDACQQLASLALSVSEVARQRATFRAHGRRKRWPISNAVWWVSSRRPARLLRPASDHLVPCRSRWSAGVALHRVRAPPRCAGERDDVGEPSAHE